MKHNFLILNLLLATLFLITCQKDEGVTKITTVSATATGALTATAQGNIIELSSASHSQYGFCYGTEANPTVADGKVELSSPKTGYFTGYITDLSAGTTYYVRAFCSEDGGYVYGEQQNFTTSDGMPILSTTEITAITGTTATSGGDIGTNGGFAITARGVCWATTTNPTTANNFTNDESNTGNFISKITGLTLVTTYYVRAYASNSLGTAYGNQQTFTTTDGRPLLTTTAITAITTTTATSGGTIQDEGVSAITAKGVCWATTQNPTTANNKTTNGIDTASFISSLTELLGSTTYYVRAYVTNSAGTAYGNELMFNTNGPGTPITDNDGNTYNTVWIGGKFWMAENLKTTKYNDGTAINNITDSTAWTTQTTGAYCWYNNDIANKATYGALYNFYAVNTGKLAPTGWHVPTDAEWTQLTDYLGGEYVAGGKMKATTLWESPNTGADNSSGLTALPGGGRGSSNGEFKGMGSHGLWWSNTLDNSSGHRTINYDGARVDKGFFNKAVGISVRCVRD
jgi:uncharacterized protein (TIGR02145 family)